MKTAFKLLFVLFVAFSMVSCASMKGYMIDRGRDALDIATLGMEGGLGVTAQAGPVLTGLGLGNKRGIGLRGGHVGKYDSTDMDFLFWGVKSFDLRNDNRHKGYEVTQGWGLITGVDMFGNEVHHTPAHVFGNIEVSAACILGVRAGFNIFEFLDFILGWTTIDIYGDDLERRRQETESNKRPELTGAPLRESPDAQP